MAGRAFRSNRRDLREIVPSSDIRITPTVTAVARPTTPSKKRRPAFIRPVGFTTGSTGPW